MFQGIEMFKRAATVAPVETCLMPRDALIQISYANLILIPAPQSMRLQQYPGHLSPDMTIDTSGNKERHVEKESFPTQLYRHIKVNNTGSD